MKKKAFYLIGVWVCAALVLSCGMAMAQDKPEILGAVSDTETVPMSMAEMDAVYGSMSYVVDSYGILHCYNMGISVACGGTTSTTTTTTPTTTTTTTGTTTTSDVYSWLTNSRTTASIITRTAAILGAQGSSAGSRIVIY
jgi:hypothetical protein